MSTGMVPMWSGSDDWSSGGAELSREGQMKQLLLGWGVSTLMMEAVRTYETSVDNRFTRQYIPEDNSEHHTRRRENLEISHTL
jgi:hypothetical protein